MGSEEDGFGRNTIADELRFGPPDRWMYCPPIGSVVFEHFLPFKTPLSKLYDDQIDAKYRFHPQHVFLHKFRGAKPGAKIGLWIDLTKTKRYYDKNEVKNNGCLYKKIPIRGHDESPTDAETTLFCETVRTFLKKHPDDIIAIHCTHGFNRTGFLIAAYLIIEMNWPVDAAVRAFAVGRPDGIYKQLYLNDLIRRYGDEDDHIEAPPQPKWENGPIEINEEKNDVTRKALTNSTGLQDGQKSTNGEVPDVTCVSDPITKGFSQNETAFWPGWENDPAVLNEELNDTIGEEATSSSSSQDEPKFMNGEVPGVTYVSDPITRNVLQNKIREMCSFKRNEFPGCQPVSMEYSPERNNVRLLVDGRYLVSWKADGIRYMVLIDDKDSIFAFDRDNSVFRITGLTFPHRKEGRHIKDTLIDCEMIIDKINESERMPRLLIFDIIKFEGEDVGACEFNTRRLCINKELIYPRIEAMKEGKILREKEPMSIRKKDFWELEAVRKLFDDKFTKSVGHEIDGLIFQPLDEPYCPGRCDTLLKWKPPSLNSVDFKLLIEKKCDLGGVPEYIGSLYVQRLNIPVATMKVTKKHLPYHGKIIECTYQKGRWEFMRERTDKSLPNSFATARAVFNSITHPIHKETLINFVEQYCLNKSKKRSSGLISDESAKKRPRV